MGGWHDGWRDGVMYSIQAAGPSIALLTSRCEGRDLVTLCWALPMFLVRCLFSCLRPIGIFLEQRVIAFRYPTYPLYNGFFLQCETSSVFWKHLEED